MCILDKEVLINMSNPDILVEEANRKLTRFSFSNLFDKTSRYEEVMPLYEKAGNIYKMAKKFDEAAQAYLKAADCSMKLGEVKEEATYYISAYNCYKKSNMPKAIECINKAIDIYNNECEYLQVVKYKRELAECYEYDGDYSNSLSCYLTCMNILEVEVNRLHYG